MNALAKFQTEELLPWNPEEIKASCELDLTDVWQEETDPENEFGEVVVGLFDTSGTLIGLRMEDDAFGQLYCHREYAGEMIGFARILELEIALERGDLMAEDAA